MESLPPRSGDGRRTTTDSGTPSERTGRRELHRQVPAERDVIACTQGDAAQGRPSGVAGRCRVLQFERPPASLRRSGAGAARQNRPDAAVTALEGQDARPLHLCVAVEPESDSLDDPACESDPLHTPD